MRRFSAMDTTIPFLVALGFLTVSSIVGLLHAVPLDGFRQIPDDPTRHRDG
jgi:hypothetical protein